MLDSINITAGDLVYVQAPNTFVDPPSQAIFLVLNNPYLTVFADREIYACDLAGSHGQIVSRVPVDWIFPALTR